MSDDPVYRVGAHPPADDPAPGWTVEDPTPDDLANLNSYACPDEEGAGWGDDHAAEKAGEKS